MRRGGGFREYTPKHTFLNSNSKSRKKDLEYIEEAEKQKEEGMMGPVMDEDGL